MEMPDRSDRFNEGSFLYDPQAKSFRLNGFRWRDTPFLIIGLTLSVLLLTGLNLLVAAVPREAALLLCGASLGYLAGDWISHRRTAGQTISGMTAEQIHRVQLSDTVKKLSSDPGHRIEAIKAYIDDSGLDLGTAKEVIDSFLKAGSSQLRD